MTPLSLIELLQWDSSFFSKSIGRVVGHHLDKTNIHTILEEGKSIHLDCLYFLADAGDPQTIELAQEASFNVVDIRVTLSWSGITFATSSFYEKELLIHPATSEDIPALEEIARDAFTNTRFYADDHFPRHLCHQLYATWIRKSVEDKSQVVNVAITEREIAGFISFLVRGDRGEIGLLGIKPGFQGRGIGMRLVNAALEWFATRQINTVTVVTQGNNIAAQHLYQNAGFRTSDTQIWFHKWFEKE